MIETVNEMNINITGKRQQITNLDLLPFPDRSLVDYEKYSQGVGMGLTKNSISIQATRGCPYKCAYCHKIWPKTHVFRSAENIFEEIKLYYDIGLRKFAFVDDVFNMNRENSSRFFELIIKHNLDVRIFFPNGVRGDILTKEYIDLMVEAGTVSIGLALETASPRLQKLIGKNLNIERFRENARYFCTKYPHIFTELLTMHGFPTETEEEAMMTLEFIKSMKWVHFPLISILKIYPGTNMEKLALENGISRDIILRSQVCEFHEVSDNLPFDRKFTLFYQTDFFHNYFLVKERLLHVLPYQMKLFSEDEIIQKYNNYFPVEIKSFTELLGYLGVEAEELSVDGCVEDKGLIIPDLNKKFEKSFPKKEPDADALRIMLLDLSRHFSGEGFRLNDYFEAPLGLIYMLSYLNQQLGSKVKGKIAKSGIDFDNFDQLKTLIEEFKPEIIGIRTLTLFKKFFHQTVEKIRQWGIDIPIITGGPYATSDYLSILQDQNIDLVVLGEGEITFCELVTAILDNKGRLPDEEVLEEIPGIAFIPTAGFRMNNTRETVIMAALS
jgi:radical SAM superfamily enzyme YgiQ (UPF0313 family)